MNPLLSVPFNFSIVVFIAQKKNHVEELLPSIGDSNEAEREKKNTSFPIALNSDISNIINNSTFPNWYGDRHLALLYSKCCGTLLWNSPN